MSSTDEVPTYREAANRNGLIMQHTCGNVRAFDRPPPKDTCGQCGYGASGVAGEGWKQLYLRDEAPDASASPPRSVVFLLWSGKHKAWWRPNAAGYTRDVDEAGRYAEADAVWHVVQSAMCGRLTEVTSMVAAPDNWTRPTGPWWAVNHPGIGVLVYDDEGQARVAAGTAGTLLTRDSPDQPWRAVA